ncbi:MAG: hypothetical protein JWR19_1826 [Pedosphaera sp.]|nr:hypothetical protein [Pedosphaera sp.]
MKAVCASRFAGNVITLSVLLFTAASSSAQTPPITNTPPLVAIVSPQSGATFTAPADISIIADTHDAEGAVSSVEFFAGTTSLGVSSNYAVVDPLPFQPPPPMPYPILAFFFDWTNVPAGDYILTAVATDSGGLMATSAPVHIVVGGIITPLPPIVSIFAPDPIAVEGTNFIRFTPPTAVTNYLKGTNTATFLVRRAGDTKSDLRVFYSIGGTASNGVDYVKIPNQVTIPAGKSFALIVINPIDDTDLVPHRFDTVVLALTLPPTAGPGPYPYSIGWPRKAAAIILEDHDLPVPFAGVLPDGCFRFSRPGLNGVNFCLQVSTNLTDWVPVCTNTVVKGEIGFVDPEAAELGTRYYRTVPVTGTPLY